MVTGPDGAPAPAARPGSPGPSAGGVITPEVAPEGQTGDASEAAAAAREPHWRRLRLAGIVVLGLWLVGLCVYSALVYHRFVLSEDYATYNQAVTLIDRGNLNPLDTIYRIPFVKADFELIVWPLALIHLVFSQPVVLLWIQDLAVVACGFVAYLWILEYLEHKQVAPRPAVLVASAVLLVTVADAGAYRTVSFDFHMEPIATFFLLLAGRGFWRGRQWQAWCFAVLALLCGSFAAIMVVGLGVSALLAGRATRRAGALLVLAGVAWTALISVLHADGGSDIANFAYLAGRTTIPAGGVVLVIKGIASHPWRALHHIYIRHRYVWQHIRAVGTVGLASAWGFGVPAVVMLVDSLDSHVNFSFSSFQNFAVLPFVLLGSVMVLVWAAMRFPRGRLAVVLLAVVVTAEAVAFGGQKDPATIRSTLAEIPAASAAALQSTLARTPRDAEVVSTVAVMGRFSGRPHVYFFAPHRSVPVQADSVVFVFSTLHLELISPAGMRRAMAYVRHDLHARLLVDAAGVTTFLWHPPRGTSVVTFPTTVAPTTVALTR